jgi:hypothetical protein
VNWLVDRKVRAESPKDHLSRLQGDKLEMLRGRRLLIAADEVEPMWARRSRCSSRGGWTTSNGSRHCSVPVTGELLHIRNLVFLIERSLNGS